jgi:hypothetical protein
MLGKIAPHQEKIILQLLDGYQKNECYEILHVGFGDPENPALDVKGWSTEIHRLQRAPIINIRGEESTRLVRKFNVIYSDIFYKDEDIIRYTGQYQTKLRSLEWFADSNFEDDLSGKQSYAKIDVMSTNLPSDSFDVIIAVGLFTKYIPSIWNCLEDVLCELVRIMNNQGQILLTLHSDYLDEFSTRTRSSGLSIAVIDSSEDTVPEANRTGHRMLLRITNCTK